MKSTFIGYVILLTSHLVMAQIPLSKQWDKRFGGQEHDYLTWFQQTTDGGYILGGYSNSHTGGDKSQSTWGDTTDFNPDYWIVKIDPAGNKQWDKRFGGTQYDRLYALQQTTDKGYILGGYSDSGVNGDKSELNWGHYDYWMVKTDSLGNKQWDKRLGGEGYDLPLTLQQTSDGGYVIGGISSSDSSGDKSQNHWGYNDYWIVKTDSFGDKQWDKRFGGTDNDELTRLQQTPDGGYILGGYSRSGISGDKTQPNRDADTIFPTEDYWVVKIDSLGNKQWDKRFGGTEEDYLQALDITNDGGYILAGSSTSELGGDKTHPPRGWTDYWVVKIDSLGNKQWDRNYGGSVNDFVVGSVTQNADGGYLISGLSASGIEGDKSQENLRHEQVWVIKVDSSGNKIWDRTLLVDGLVTGGGLTGTEGRVTGYAIETPDNCYVIASSTTAGIGGDKSEPSRSTIPGPLQHSFYDYWVIKFCSCNAIDVTINSVTDVSCIGANDGGAKAIALGGTPPYDYTWSDGQTSESAIDLSSGNYHLTATDSRGCSATTSFTIPVGSIPCTGIESNEPKDISVYPNPAKDAISLKLPAPGKGELKLVSMFGKIVSYQKFTNTSEYTIDISSLSNAVYLLEITTPAGLYFKKFTKIE